MNDCPTPNKKAYTSRRAAEYSLHKAWRKPYQRGWKLPVRTYKCRCQKWHMTAQPLRHHKETA